MAALAALAPAILTLLAPLGAMLLAAAVPSATSCLHSLGQVEADFVPPDFSYTGESGPLNWHGNAKYEKCARGRYQSPINIVPGYPGIKTVDVVQRPILKYATVETTELVNLGSTIEVHASGNLTFGGATWALRQFHFHTPSEHRLKEEHFPVEVHFVHDRLGKAN